MGFTPFKFEFLILLMQQVVQQHSYKKTFGSYRPQFEGKPEGYYQLQNKQICCAISACVGVILLIFSTCFLFFVWSRKSSTNSLILICILLLVIFVPLLLALSYLQSKDKLIKDEELIKQALQHQLVSKEYKRQWSRQSVKVAAHLQYQFQH